MTPLEALKRAAADFALAIGADAPRRIVLEIPGIEPHLAIVCTPSLGPRLSRMELVVYQAIRSSERPIGLKEIVLQTGRSKSSVCAALAVLRQRGMVDNVDADGYTDKAIG
jgi:hypothetical protein